MTQAARHKAHPPNKETRPALPSERQARGSLFAHAELEQRLRAYKQQALACMEARRFAEARDQFACAVDLIRRALETVPDLTCNLALIADLCYHYGALLTRLEDFVTAARYLTRARNYFCRLETRALLKGSRRTYQHFRLGKERVELESAFLALRRRAYPQALTQAARLLLVSSQHTAPPQFRRLRACAHLVRAWAYYECRQYREAQEQVTRARNVDRTCEEAEPLFALTQAHLLHAAGKDEDALAAGIAGCQRLLRRLEIACSEAASWPAQLNAVVETLCGVRREASLRARLMPGEREELGHFCVVLGALQHARGQISQALSFFLLAGSLLPQADVLDIPEFELLTRELGERARRDPQAFATLQALCTHPEVRQRWEFLEATVEAVGRVVLGPALATIAALKTRLPGKLPMDTRALLEEIQKDLEQGLQIDGETAGTIGIQVLSNTSVRFVVTASFTRDKLGVMLDLMEAVVRRWQLAEAGMADPEPSTPETETLTDDLEEGLVQRFMEPQ